MKQKPSERKKLRKVKPRQTRAQRLASSLNTKNLEPVKAEDPNPWPRLAAWVKRVLRIGK